MSDLVERLRKKVERFITMEATHTKTLEWEAAARIEQLEAALDTVRASGLLIGSTTLHDRVRSAVYNAIDANPAALEERT